MYLLFDETNKANADPTSLLNVKFVETCGYFSGLVINNVTEHPWLHIAIRFSL